MRFFIVLIVCAFLTACGTTKTTLKPYAYDHQETAGFFTKTGQAPEVSQLYEASYDAVWKAVLTAIREMGHPIQTINEENGVFTTDWLSRAGAPFFMGVPFSHFRDRFTINVIKRGENRIEVGIRRTMQLKKDDDYSLCTSDGEIEKWLLEQVEQMVK